MTHEGYKRKLTAILSADVAGYSRLMGEDEDATIRTLTTYRELMATLIQKHRGRVVDSPGDNLLAEFGSVVDAVRCAVEIQEELRVRNAELPETRKMHFRIGINLGDVVQEEERIYGDGINIAARVEGLAEGGGICISGTVYDSIKNKLSLTYESLGEHTVKNITEPVRVYRMRVGPEAAVKTVPRRWHKPALAALVVLIVAAGAWAIWNFYFRPPPIEPASVEKMAYPLPDRPSIAILPFVNLSGDPKQEYFSDGITALIITQLFKIPDMFVIHKSSSFAYKDKAAKIQQVAEELGVRYVLEGSVQRAGDRIRVNAQLIDAITGEHRWAERYDRELKDMFAVQDEITRNVVTELAVQMTQGEWARRMIHASDNYEAVDCYLRADKELTKFEKEANVRGRELLIKAVELDPNYARAIAYLGYTYWYDVSLGWAKNPTESFQQAQELAERAVATNEKDYLGHALLSRIYAHKRNYERSIAAGKRAVEVEPSNANAIFVFGYTMLFAGMPAEALVLCKKAMRLSPYPPSYFHHLAGSANYLAGQYEAAITQYRKYLLRQQHGGLARWARQWLMASYVKLGREEEARAEVDKFLNRDPKICIKALIRATKKVPFKDYGFLDPQIELLRKAGLPETPPLTLPNKPSIAVLPFVNMSEDPKQEYFSDGITEEIITGLSKTPNLFVIARNSTFTYKNKPTKVQQVGRELGVRYVLEGSFRKAGDKVRITAQLIDAKTGNHLWAERYDRELKDIFAIQDEITKKIITALQVELTEGEQARLYAKGTDDLIAYLKAMEGRWYCLQSTKDGNRLARKLAEEAIALDPKYAFAYNVLGITHLNDLWLGLSKSPRNSLMQAIKMAKKAIALDDSDAGSHALLGYCLTMARRHDEGIAEGEKAVSLGPSSAGALHLYATILTYAGRREEAIPLFREALRLNPMPPNIFYKHFGMVLRDTGQYEEAIALQKKAIEQEPNDIIAYVVLASSYGLAGREEEAKAAAKEILKINPTYSVDRLEKVSPHKDRAVAKRFCDALRKAGLK